MNPLHRNLLAIMLLLGGLAAAVGVLDLAREHPEALPEAAPDLIGADSAPAPAEADQEDDPPGMPVGDALLACDTDNPFFLTTCFPEGVEDGEPALVAFRDTPDDSEHYVVATSDQIGSAFGVAYHHEDKAAFVSAFHKRGSPFGPSGTGGVYRVDVATGATETWVTVPSAGRDLHDKSGDYWPDIKARNYVGVVSLGDIDLGADNTELFVMNLLDRKIYRYRVADKAQLGAFAIGAKSEDWYRDARPFGLKVWKGKLYHAVVNSAARSEERDDLRAYVYQSDLDGGNMRTVVDFSLDYQRGSAAYDFSARWRPWKDGYNSISRSIAIYPQPMFTDIEFSDTGDMLLGFRDRLGDMTFYAPSGPNPPDEQRGIPAGDLLIGRYDEDNDMWTVDPAPEFFKQDAGPGMAAEDAVHDESGFGGLARVQKVDQVVMSAMAPFRTRSGGAFWFDNQRGDNTAREELYHFLHEVNFGKGNGLGDVEVVCGKFIPTPTPTVSETPTATDTPTITPTSTDTLTPSITPTPEPFEIYLPFGNKDEYCPKDAFFTDVVLVLDRSTSMLRAVEPGGIPKNQAAIDAAKSFVGNLDFTPDWRGRHDQVAVVGFNDLAWIESDLVSDPNLALAALDRIGGKTQEGTRLDLAFTWGQKPLDGPMRRPENRPVIIMLTDGLPNRVPFGEGSPYPGSQRQEDSVLMAVDAVKATGSRVYTVGLGTPRDILPWLLIDCASERWMYHYAPRPEELAGIYGQIARTFDSCDPKPAPTPCSPEFQHADVVLVLDMSTSMYRTTRTGRAKYEAAISAARDFVAQLDLERDGWGRRDQVAIVGFNGQAWTSIGLGDDRGAIEAAIDRLEDDIQEGTRLDLALAEGQRVYEIGERLQPNEPVMILLTDGLPNQVPFGAGSPHPECERQECTVLKIADQVKGKGTRLYTIGLGLGDDVLRPLMENVATDPSMYYHAPDGEDLSGIYRQIAGRLSDCP